VPPGSTAMFGSPTTSPGPAATVFTGRSASSSRSTAGARPASGSTTTDKRLAAASRSAVWPASEHTVTRWPGTTNLKTSTSTALPASVRSMLPFTAEAGGVPAQASSWACTGVLLGSRSAVDGGPPASFGRCTTTTAAALPRAKCGAFRQERPARAESRPATTTNAQGAKGRTTRTRAR